MNFSLFLYLILRSEWHRVGGIFLSDQKHFLFDEASFVQGVAGAVSLDRIANLFAAINRPLPCISFLIEGTAP